MSALGSERAYVLRALGCALLVGSASCVAQGAVKPASSAGAAGAPRKESPFEQRWLHACGESGLLGELPVVTTLVFDVDAKLAVAQDAPDTSAEAATPMDRDWSWQGDARRVRIHRLLTEHREQLRACFASSEQAWVRLPLARASSGSRQASTGLSPRVVACVARVVDAALAGEAPPGAEALLVARGESADRPGAGSLSRQGIRETIHGYIGEVRACYEAAIAVWPRLAGRHAPKFVIAPDGKVAIVQTSVSTFHNPALECCINTALKGWQFDQPANYGFVVVTYPFVLEQQAGGTRPSPSRSLAR